MVPEKTRDPANGVSTLSAAPAPTPHPPKVRAVRVTSAQPESPALVGLELESIDSLAQSLIPPSSTSTAFVIATDDVSALFAFPQLFHDCGTKHRAVPLARAMLGHDAVALIRAPHYEGRARALAGVGSLLKEASTRKQVGPFVVALPLEVFEAVVRSVSADSPRDATSSLLCTRPEVLDGLPAEKVDEELWRKRFLGRSPAAELVRRLIVRCTHNNIRVLIVGPTGCGKEVVARAIHDFSPRKQKPFKAINCGAMQSSLFESELFGYGKGAFTGASRDNPGLWRSAGEGTLFLDEIGELSLEMQSKLLRALEMNEVRPLGATNDIPVKARVITATNRNLDVLVRAGRFRKDLYYRIRGLLLPVPALRARVEDIPQLAQFFWRRIAHKHGAAAVLPPAVLGILCSYEWPGNVRELLSVLEALYAMYEKPCPTVSELRRTLFAEGQAPAIFDPEPGDEHSRQNADCLKHLRRADEILRACEVTLAPLLRKAKPAPAEVLETDETLHLRLQELELLCMHPVLFGTQVTFNLVHHLKNRLQAVHQLLARELPAARRCWKTEIVPQLGSVRGAIFGEMGRG